VTKQVLRSLPREDIYAAWPTLKTLSQDRQWIVKPLSQRELHQRLRRQTNRLLRQDVISAFPKGLFFGIVFFSVIHGLWPVLAVVQYDWYWPWYIIGSLASIALIGLEVTTLVVVVAAGWLSRGEFLLHPLQLGVCLLCGIVLRISLEVFL
jgi:hypothetical protein